MASTWQISVQWLSHETVWKLGALFKNCIKVVIPEYGSKDGRYAKLLVEVDLKKPLVMGTKLHYNGKMRCVEDKYENPPIFLFGKTFIVEWLGTGRECVKGKKRMHKNQNYMRVNLGSGLG